ncbi:MAG TPA: hypothetical protein EYO20_06895 [Gemmatimonadetes bacterium]|nr:hypothetical protein [Gemmatimonadota bacterium]
MTDIRTLVTMLMTTTVLVAGMGCSDLALEPDRNPTALSVLPIDTVLTKGHTAALRAVVTDQNQQPFTPLPTWARTAWSISDPQILRVSGDGSMEGLKGGEVTVAGEVAGLLAETRVRVNPTEVQLSAPFVHLIQSVQTLTGSFPLIAGKDALLRVFMTGDQMSFFEPTVRASFYSGDEVVYSVRMLSPLYFLPVSPDQSQLNRSYNTRVPGTVLQPGVELVIELDPERVIPLAAGSSVRVPESGRTALITREVEPFRLRVVPVLAPGSPFPASSGQIFNWTGNLSEYADQVQYTRLVYPISEFEVDVRETYTTLVNLTEKSGWSSFLREIDLLRRTDPDGPGHYYYGAVTLPQGSAWGGLGYIGRPTSVGRPSEFTLAHELGHNMRLRHAPCGGPSGPDQNYPYSGGFIGKWGYDPRGASGLGELKDPGVIKDLMSYCSPEWISDYHFQKSLAFRMNEGPSSRQSDRSQPSEDVLILWGGSDDGVLTLEPAIHMNAPAVLPDGDGPYRIEGFNENGGSLFSLNFSLTETEYIDGGHFYFALPFDAGAADELDRIQLLGPEGQVELGGAVPGPNLAVITNRQTGRIQSIIREWDETLPVSPEVDVLVTDGVITRRIIGGME